MGDHKEEQKVDEEAEIYLEAKKILRTIKPCSPLDWSGPSANEVYERLYVGNRFSALSIEYLKSLGITHLLNAAHGDAEYTDSNYSAYACKVNVNEENLAKAGIKYLGLKLEDNEEQEIGSQFPASGEWIESALNESGQTKVLVNCWAGISRSSTIAIAFLMNHRGLSLSQALKHAKSARDINPNSRFLKELIILEINRRKMSQQ